MGGPATAVLEAGTLVFGDLHLDPADPTGCIAFARWLDALPGDARLVILGDLFEYWVGPAQAELAGMGEVLDALSAYEGPIDLIPGNRDFLLGTPFERRTGVVLRPEGLLGQGPRGSRTLLLHGDELCTADRAYQRLRGVLRSRFVRWTAPRLPRAAGLALARRLRVASRRAVESKRPLEVEMDGREVRRRLSRAEADGLVCGHAHRFRDTVLDPGGRWWVLDAWGGPRDLLCLAEDGTWRPGSHRDAAP